MKHNTPADTAAAVDTFMAALAHPFWHEIQALRATILGADPGIAEGIKWQAPSFRTDEYFATTYLRDKAGIAIILHRGAKAREGGVALDDPAHLLDWLAKDRAKVVFRDMADIDHKRAAFADLIRAWVRVL
jgi:hypothetical protein